jgi:L,D-transpeptidase catalytic domain
MLLVTALALAGAASVTTDAALARGELVSDELTHTSWAHPTVSEAIRRYPVPTSQRIARIHYLTEDGFPEVYLVLRRWTDSAGRRWLQVRIPKRPNGQIGWVRGTALGPLRVVHTRLVVNRFLLRATLYKYGRRIWQSPVGIGAPGTPTPDGHFWIRERMRVPDPGGLYGPWAFGTSAYSSLSDWPGGGVIGIHGTNQPELIPGRPSHGCIRVENVAISRLATLMPIGTPVRIR